MLEIELPPKLSLAAKELISIPKTSQLQAILGYSKELVALPAKYHLNSSLMRPIQECISPVFVAVEQGGGVFTIYFKVPQSAALMRGYAGLLAYSLSGESKASILSVPDNFHELLGLSELVSPMRIRGMAAVIRHLKTEVVASGA